MGLLLRVRRALGLNGEVLGGSSVVASLASGVRVVSSYATFVVRDGESLGGELARVTATVPVVAGRRAGVTMPGFLVSGKSGRSCKEWLMRYSVVAACRSYEERDRAANGGF